MKKVHAKEKNCIVDLEFLQLSSKKNYIYMMCEVHIADKKRDFYSHNFHTQDEEIVVNVYIESLSFIG